MCFLFGQHDTLNFQL